MIAPSKGDPFAWFRDAGFGLFIHWGLYSILGRGEQALFRERLKPSEYRALAGRFSARSFNADEWARLARRAGMRYAILTAKHHDGFCLFDSALTGYNSAQTAAGRDLVGEYVRAMRKQGLRVGLYYSLADWSWPAYFRGPSRDPEGFGAFIRYTHGQVRELCSNYGKIDLLFFDGGWPHDARAWQSERLDALIRRLQPLVMMNDRLHGGGTGNVTAVGSMSRRTRGYYNTFEQRAVTGDAIARPHETLRTTQDFWWGYHGGDRLWKSPGEVVKMLASAAASDANLALNVGPTAQGRLPAAFTRILRETGRWLSVGGESIFGARPIQGLDLTTVGSLATVKPSRLYIHAFYWPGTRFSIHGLANKVTGVRVLGRPGRVRFRQDGLDLRIDGLPRRAPDPSCAVICVHCVGTPGEAPGVVHLWEGVKDTSSLAEWAGGD